MTKGDTALVIHFTSGDVSMLEVKKQAENSINKTE